MIDIDHYLYIIERQQYIAFIILYQNLSHLLLFLVVICFIDEKVVVELIHLSLIVAKIVDDVLVASNLVM